MELQITTLIENEPDDKGELKYEHGLSLYIEFQGKKILFDTGQTGAFLENAKALGKSLEAVDYILISHGHYDHSGGVPRLLETLEKKLVLSEDKPTDKIPMLVGAEFFHPKYKQLPNGSRHYNGNPFGEGEVGNAPVVLKKINQDITYIAENIVVFKNFKRYTKFEQINPKFFVKQLQVGTDKAGIGIEPQEKYLQDEFVDEIALGLITTKGIVLVVGCSHVGIVNILENVTERTGLPIYAVLGGTHLVEAGEERLQETMSAFRRLKVQEIAVSHCTGEQGMFYAKRAFGANFIRNNTGNVYIQ
ncbi:MAG: MBL fold metallo-hydrolase [Lachnospiraceae bacterium]|nr:MBL fold metallo-hydrolase [Lachnospiraceae bacterium]